MQCKLRAAATDDGPTDGASPFDRVDWAGLPVKLDLAFSQQQCDRVYAQHMKRKRGFELWRESRKRAAPCVCEMAAANDSAEASPAATMQNSTPNAADAALSV
ncbi:hypothetical protein H7J50_10665 [Mycobacterium intermedium]|nr:hypothetical protein [Mycobacterium intermedium]